MWYRTRNTSLVLLALLILFCARANAALQYVTSASSHASTCGTANNTGTIAQPAANSLIIFYAISSTTGTLGLPTGFNSEDSQTNSFKLLEGYKIASGSGETTFSFTDSLANGFCDSWIIVVSGENTSTPFDKHTINLSTLNASTGPFTTTAATPTGAGDLPIAMLNTGTSSQVVSSKSPTTLTDLGDSGAISNHLMYDSLAGAGSYTASMTMTAANAFAHQIEVLDMISPAAGGGTTLHQMMTLGVGAIIGGGGGGPVGCPAGAYCYHGVQVYNGAAAAPDPVVNKDITAAPTDANSTTVLNNVGPKITWGMGAGVPTLEAVNLASTATTQYTVGTISGGHNPPFQLGTYGGGTGQTEPWVNGWYIEGTSGQTCTATTKSGDCHSDVLVDSGTGANADYTYQCGQQGWTAPSTLNAYSCILQNLQASWTSNASNRTDTPTVGGIPLLGFADYGEDASLSSINHPLDVIIPTSALISGNSSVNYATGANGGGTCSGTTTCMELGDIIELTGPASNYSGLGGCTDTQSVLVLNQLYHFGAVVDDTGSTPVFRFGLDTNGANDWHTAVWTCLNNLTLNTTNWRIISRTYF